MDKCEICQATVVKWMKGRASIADLLEDEVVSHLRECACCFQFLAVQLHLISMAIPAAVVQELSACEAYRQLLFGIAHGKEPENEKSAELARLHSLLCESCGDYFFKEYGKDETIKVPPLPRKVLEALLETGTEIPEGETVH
jgi:hypothetical protein